MEKYEGWDECASRELEEETALKFSSDRFKFMEPLNCQRVNINYHSISLIMYSEINENEKECVKNLEPDKCEKWLWVSINQLRNNFKFLFYPLQDFLLKYPKLTSTDQLKTFLCPLSLSSTHVKTKLSSGKKSNFTSDDFISSSKSNDSTFEEEYFITKEDFYHEYAI